MKVAIALGCAASETDVHLTADGALVINQDEVWAGLQIRESTLQELQKTKLFNGETLPLLTGFLKIIQHQSKTRLVLEIKPAKGETDEPELLFKEIKKSFIPGRK